MKLQGIILKNEDCYYGDCNDEAEFTCYSTSERSTSLNFKVEVPKEIKEALFKMAEQQMKEALLKELNNDTQN